MQETWVQSLIWEDPICWGATKPVSHNYWTCALEPGSCNYWVHGLQRLKPVCSRACAPQYEKPLPWEACILQIESSPHSTQLEKNPAQQQRPRAAKKKKTTKNLESSFPPQVSSTCGFQGMENPSFNPSILGQLYMKATQGRRRLKGVQ